MHLMRVMWGAMGAMLEATDVRKKLHYFKANIRVALDRRTSRATQRREVTLGGESLKGTARVLSAAPPSRRRTCGPKRLGYQLVRGGRLMSPVRCRFLREANEIGVGRHREFRLVERAPGF
jgi:hypothetical protein